MALAAGFKADCIHGSVDFSDSEDLLKVVFDLAIADVNGLTAEAACLG